MQEKNFEIVLYEVNDKYRVLEELMFLFKYSKEECRALMESLPAKVGPTMSEEEAKRYAAQLEEAGALVQIQKIEPESITRRGNIHALLRESGVDPLTGASLDVDSFLDEAFGEGGGERSSSPGSPIEIESTERDDEPTRVRFIPELARKGEEEEGNSEGSVVSYILKTLGCPVCGFVQPESERCGQCGIVFAEIRTCDTCNRIYDGQKYDTCPACAPSTDREGKKREAKVFKGITVRCPSCGVEQPWSVSCSACGMPFSRQKGKPRSRPRPASTLPTDETVIAAPPPRRTERKAPVDHDLIAQQLKRPRQRLSPIKRVEGESFWGEELVGPGLILRVGLGMAALGGAAFWWLRGTEVDRWESILFLFFLVLAGIYMTLTVFGGIFLPTRRRFAMEGIALLLVGIPLAYLALGRAPSTPQPSVTAVAPAVPSRGPKGRPPRREKSPLPPPVEIETHANYLTEKLSPLIIDIPEIGDRFASWTPSKVMRRRIGYRIRVPASDWVIHRGDPAVIGAPEVALVQNQGQGACLVTPRPNLFFTAEQLRDNVLADLKNRWTEFTPRSEHGVRVGKMEGRRVIATAVDPFDGALLPVAFELTYLSDGNGFCMEITCLAPKSHYEEIRGDFRKVVANLRILEGAGKATAALAGKAPTQPIRSTTPSSAPSPFPPTSQQDETPKFREPVVLYTWKDTFDSARARKFLEERKIPYIEKELSEHPEYRKELQRITRRRNLVHPVFVTGHTIIRGYNAIKLNEVFGPSPK